MFRDRLRVLPFADAENDNRDASRDLREKRISHFNLLRRVPSGTAVRIKNPSACNFAVLRDIR